jgi:hypothetical protein
MVSLLLVSSREVSILSNKEASSEYISPEDSYFKRFVKEINRVTMAFIPEMIPTFHDLHSTKGDIIVINALMRIAGITRQFNFCCVRSLD